LIEEAHRLLATPRSHGPEQSDARGKAVQMFTDLLAELRAYGEGFVVADQIPTKLVPDILKNTALKILHRLAALDDRQAMGGAYNLTVEQIRAINLLQPGGANGRQQDHEASRPRLPKPSLLSAISVARLALQFLWRPRTPQSWSFLPFKTAAV
jgi:hypothetical protein